MNTNNNSSVPLLVPSTKKKGSAKKSRVRVRPKKKPVAAVKRKVNKISAGVGVGAGAGGVIGVAVGANKSQRVHVVTNRDASTPSSTPNENDVYGTANAIVTAADSQRRTSNFNNVVGTTTRNSSSTSISIGSSIQKSNERQIIVTQSQQSQHSNDNTSSYPTTNTGDSNTSSSAAASSSSTTFKYTIDESDIIPYQHLGQLDPAWNIPQPENSEKTMKDFCSKFKLPKEVGKKNNEEQEEKDNNGQEEETNHNNNNNNTNNSTTNSADNTNPEPANDDQRSGPLVEVINGEIVIKETSMIVGRRQTTEEVDRELNNAVVEEDNTTLNVTYRSFAVREKSIRWTVEETRKFYKALRQCGTDFTTMSNFFDGSDGSRKRSRKQLKSKYKIECRKNMKLIDMAMNPKVQMKLDMSVFGELDMENADNAVTSATSATTATTATAASNTETSANTVDLSNADEQNDGDSNDPGSYDVLTITATPSTNPLNITPSMIGTSSAEVMQPSSSTATLIAIAKDVFPDAEHNESPTPTSMPVVTQDDLSKQEKENQEKANEERIEVENIPIVLPGATKRKKKPKFRARPKPGSKGKKK